MDGVGGGAKSATSAPWSSRSRSPMAAFLPPCHRAMAGNTIFLRWKYAAEGLYGIRGTTPHQSYRAARRHVGTMSQASHGPLPDIDTVVPA